MYNDTLGDACAADAGSAAPPDFIRIAGEAGKQAEQQHSSKASQEQPAATSRRNQLKAALKQLLAYGSAAGQQPNVAESLQRVLRMQQAQTQQQGVFAGQQQQLHQVASQLQQLLQSLHIQPNKQQWRHSSKRWEQVTKRFAVLKNDCASMNVSFCLLAWF